MCLRRFQPRQTGATLYVDSLLLRELAPGGTDLETQGPSDMSLWDAVPPSFTEVNDRNGLW